MSINKNVILARAHFRPVRTRQHFVRAQFPDLAHFGANMPISVPPPSNMIPSMMGGNYHSQPQAFSIPSNQVDKNSNVDSLLHVHRRKLQRRAANRKSAQLSRARKKALLDELQCENARLQQLVDVLDSQPELIFCVNAKGGITYISERTVNFVNVTSTNGKEEEPKHINQILTRGSADSVLQTIQEIMKVAPPRSALAESNMLFSSKVVEFQDSFGNPSIGYMRCARVNRRQITEEEHEEEDISDAVTPAAKKVKTKQEAETRTPCITEDKSLANFKLLTDCASHMSHTYATIAPPVVPALSSDPEADSEFVCVIRTSDSCFARFSTRSDLYMFVSTPLSTASMQAHDRRDAHLYHTQQQLQQRGAGSAATTASSSSSSSGSEAGLKVGGSSVLASAAVAEGCVSDGSSYGGISGCTIASTSCDNNSSDGQDEAST